MFGEAPTGSDGGAAGANEIVTIGAGDSFNDAELAQACELSGQGAAHCSRCLSTGCFLKTI